MFYIQKIVIHNFRGQKQPIEFSLRDDVNFIIGRNGTGKTTLINLINSALSADMKALIKIDFSKISFTLVSRRNKNHPNITISKKVDEEKNLYLFFSFSENTKSKPKIISYSINDFVTPWRMMKIRWSDSTDSIADEENDPASEIQAELSKYVNTSWISVNRAEANRQKNDDKFESPVDKKMHQVSRNFGVYFSTLDKMSAEETDKFQQVYLLSLISPSKFDGISMVQSLDTNEEKAALRGMLQEFKIKANIFLPKLENFSKKMDRAIKNYEINSKLIAEDFLVLTDLVRIHDVVNEWHKLLGKRKEIYQPKEDFKQIMNMLLFRKKIEINSGNEPIFLDGYGNDIPISSLSSGEKQLFIILGESLLQRKDECIFMADEPELSLHIDWQENLVPSLKKINPNSQVIFATHSPDIVGAYKDRTINLEKML